VLLRRSVKGHREVEHERVPADQTTRQVAVIPDRMRGAHVLLMHVIDLTGSLDGTSPELP